VYCDDLIVVEDLSKRREPLPTLEAVYLIMPTRSVSISLAAHTLPCVRISQIGLPFKLRDIIHST